MPFGRIPPGRLRVLVVPTAIVYALAWLPFMLVGEPSEMVRLQRAGSEAVARAIVTSWSPKEIVDMAFLQGVDNVHLLAYAIILAAAAVWAGRQLDGRAARWAPTLAWIPVAAAAFDLAENVGMTAMIRGDTRAPIPAITTSFAYAKYSMFVVVVPYVLAGLVRFVRRQVR